MQLSGSIQASTQAPGQTTGVAGTTRHYIHEYVAIESQENVNFAFWWSYMEISILLMFTQAICDGQWNLYLYALSEMVPYIASVDRYQEKSIKARTRKKRSKRSRPIRHVIENRDVPLPKKWTNFLALPENKADLAHFLSAQHISCNYTNIEVVAAGGFEDKREVISTNPSTDVTPLQASHEEADTRMVLHAVNSSFDTVVLLAWDTDVFLLLIHHFENMQCTNLWMVAGTSKRRKFVPIHTLCDQLPPMLRSNLFAFHALAGCDVTSYLANNSKRAGWKVFTSHAELLSELGKVPLTENAVHSAEEFVVKLYRVGSQVTSVDSARHALFAKAKQNRVMHSNSTSCGHTTKQPYGRMPTMLKWNFLHQMTQDGNLMLEENWPPF
ncbi:UNVERIFIED_CONTAM: hypothetical protein FKN15_037020 [Acipenser sinensis]